MTLAYRCDYCGGFTDPHVRQAVEDGDRVDPKQVKTKSRDCRRKACIAKRKERKAA